MWALWFEAAWLVLVVGLYLGQFIWVGWEVGLTPTGAAAALGAVLALNAGFLGLYAWGSRRERARSGPGPQGLGAL